ncbi:hypothetical protein FS847_00960 [Streptomyces sp. ISID311]|nr:hypothetical protein FS847_00960 [Streptomyces sp. ISID311]
MVSTACRRTSKSSTRIPSCLCWPNTLSTRQQSPLHDASSTNTSGVLLSNDVEAVLHRHILGVLTDLGADDIRPERSLNDLGANSLDRIDILSGALEELQVDLRPEELREAMDLRQLAALLQKCTAP